MSDDEFHDQIKWAARLEHVREVSLLGTADLSYWMRQLEPEELFPVDYDGQAQIMIVGADSKFMGVPFREISFSVLVEPPDNRFGREAAYLIQAFNSSRFFAFCERTFFSTPYSYGGTMVSASHPVSIKLSGIAGGLFDAQQQAVQREPLRCGDDGWEGPIYLPVKHRTGNRQGKLFFACIRGETKTYGFQRSQDRMTLTPAACTPVLQALHDSNFAPQQWAIRNDATHAKSKTYRRTAASRKSEG